MSFPSNASLGLMEIGVGALVLILVALSVLGLLAVELLGLIYLIVSLTGRNSSKVHGTE